MLYKTLGKRISNVRKEARMTQAELSEKIGISEKYLSRIECDRQVPNIIVVSKICEVLNISADELLSLHIIKKHDGDIANEISDFTVYERKQIVEIIKIIKKLSRSNR